MVKSTDSGSQLLDSTLDYTWLTSLLIISLHVSCFPLTVPESNMELIETC